MTISPAEKPDSYIARCLRNAGVPELWIGDAIQDVRIALWKQEGKPVPTIVHYAAIDAARKYGWHGRHGNPRFVVGTNCHSLDALIEEAAGERVHATAMSAANLKAIEPPSVAEALLAVKSLPTRERAIIDLRLAEWTLLEISELLGVSEARVGQIERRTKKKLRQICA